MKSLAQVLQADRIGMNLIQVGAYFRHQIRPCDAFLSDIHQHIPRYSFMDS